MYWNMIQNEVGFMLQCCSGQIDSHVSVSKLGKYLAIGVVVHDIEGVKTGIPSCICVRGPSSYFTFAMVFVRAVR